VSAQGPDANDFASLLPVDTSVDDASVGDSGSEQATKRIMVSIAKLILSMNEPVINVDELSYQVWPLVQIAGNRNVAGNNRGKIMTAWMEDAIPVAPCLTVPMSRRLLLSAPASAGTGYTGLIFDGLPNPFCPRKYRHPVPRRR
jgi:hypothetical protein